MTVRRSSSLVVSSDAGAPCSIVEGDPDAAGFAVDDLDQSPAMVARRFVVSDDPQSDTLEWRRGLWEVDEHINYYDEYDLPAGSLGASCNSGANVRFGLRFDHAQATVTVVVRIHLIHGRGYMRDYREAIEAAWSGHCALVATSGEPPSPTYRILVNVDWVDAAEDPHYTVTLHRAGCHRWRMREWYSTGPDQIAAHEFGHMLGNIDTYDGSDDECPDRPVRSGIMCNEHRWRVASPENYYLVGRYAGECLCAIFEVQALPLGDVGLSATDDVDPGRLQGGLESLQKWEPMCDFLFDILGGAL